MPPINIGILYGLAGRDIDYLNVLKSHLLEPLLKCDVSSTVTYKVEVYTFFVLPNVSIIADVFTCNVVWSLSDFWDKNTVPLLAKIPPDDYEKRETNQLLLRTVAKMSDSGELMETFQTFVALWLIPATIVELLSE